MTEYSDNLTEEDVEAVLRALPDHAITGEEISMLLSAVVMQFCDSPMSAVTILRQAAGMFVAADGADHDGRVIQ